MDRRRSDLIHCSAHGATPEEALREVEVTIEAWLEAQAAEGQPAPRYRPAIYATAMLREDALLCKRRMRGPSNTPWRG